MNRWGIPKEIEVEVLKRDTACVYCRTVFGPSGGTIASWEHIINDCSITDLENIARCCISCNSSKGAKSLRKWFESPYCKKKGINRTSVANVVRVHIEKYGY